MGSLGAARRAYQARRERERQGRREDILAAARKVFSERGFFAATVSEIAARAQYSKAAIYFYFQSKEELYIALLLDGLEVLRVRLEAVVAELARLSGPAALDRVWQVFADHYREDPDFYSIVAFLQHEDIKSAAPAELVGRIDQLGGHNFGLMRQVIVHGIQRGEFATAHPWLTAQALWAAFVGAVQLTRSQEHLSPRPGNDLALLDTVYHALCQGLLVR